MGFNCGIVGLPNVGKSTLFNALTKAGHRGGELSVLHDRTRTPASSRCRIPGSIELPRSSKPQKVIPTTMEFVDIAGLVAGASKGEGLGNQFLAHIRETDAVAHVVRCFVDDNVVHVSDAVSPRDDIEVIDTELALADLETVERVYDRSRRTANAGDKDAKILVALLERVRAALNEGRPVRALGLDADDSSGCANCT